MKKVLFISYYFAPYQVTGSLRAIRFARYFPRHNVQPYILTGYEGEHHWNPALLNDLESRVQIIRINNPFPNRAGKGATFLYKKTSWLKKIRNRLIILIKDLLFSPDIYILWSLKVILRGVKLIKENEIDNIIVTVGPYSPAITGLILSKLTKARYSIDFRDEWDNKKWYRQYSFIRILANKFWEHVCVKNAHSVFVVTETMAKIIEDKHQASAKFHVAHNGFDEEEFKDIVYQKEEKNDGKAIFAYAGKLDINSKIYNPVKMLEGFKLFLESTVKECILNVYADVKEPTKILISNMGLDDHIIMHGYKNREDLLRELEKADYLVNFNYPDIHYETLGIKLFEYLYLRRPVLSFVSPESEVAKLHDITGCGLYCWGNDVKAIAETFLRILDFNAGYLFTDEYAQRIDQYNVDNITGYIAEKLYKMD